jgi:hypothetical protein
MKVSNLQQFVRSLIAPMQQAGANAKKLEDIELTCGDLQPFAEMEVWQLADLLRQTKEHRDTGKWPELPTKRPSAPKSKAPKKDASAVILEFSQQVRALEEKAASPESTQEDLTSELDTLKLDKLTVPQLSGIARELHQHPDAKAKKPALVELIRRVVLVRKEELASARS